jgi:monofunctional glycosyltransferase
MTQQTRGFFGWAWYLLWRFVLTGMVLLLLLLVLLRFIPPPTSAFMLQSPYPVRQHWVSLDTLPAHLSLALVASEDQRFPTHYGVDMAEISKALAQFDDGDGLRGASTITQQTAKNLLLWPGRSLVRKGLEALLALGLEGLWGKKRILEVYVNIAEFGPGIYGVEAASQHYYGKPARALSRNQSARLAVLLPSPRKRDPRRLTPYLEQRVVWVERQMQQLGSGYLNAVLR